MSGNRPEVCGHLAGDQRSKKTAHEARMCLFVLLCRAARINNDYACKYPSMHFQSRPALFYIGSCMSNEPRMHVPEYLFVVSATIDGLALKPLRLHFHA